MTKKNNKNILVIGDYAIDSLYFVNNKQRGENPNYKHYDLVNGSIIYGGTQLLVNFIKNTLNKETNISYFDIKEYNIKNYTPNKEIPLSINIISEYSNDIDKKYRISSTLGYLDCQLLSNNIKINEETPSLVEKIENIIKNIEDNQFIILNDYGVILRNNNKILSVLQRETKGKENIKFLLKMHKPLFKGDLWDWLSEKDPIVLVNANDLRSGGLKISRGLSWERTVHDITSQLILLGKTNKMINQLKKVRHLLIWFDVDGLLYLYQIDETSYLATIIYDPKYLEEGNKNSVQGSIQGLMSAFFGTFIANISNNNLNYLDKNKSNSALAEDHYIIVDAIIKGMKVTHNLLQIGYHKKKYGEKSITNYFEYPFEDLKPEATFSYAKKIVAEFDQSYDLSNWSIINESGSHYLWRAARTIVKYGFKTIKENIPYAEYGKFITFDRMEIESYKEIEKIFRRFSESQKQSISAIGVFGPPGSGKSFGIEELSKSFGEDIFKTIKINLSQLKTPNELATKFHEIRNASLKGKKPIVLVDEFDSKIDNEDLGWLKYFLSPIQDGEFSDGSGIHPIGDAIFVFIGGTCDSLKELQEGPISLSEEERKNYKAKFKSNKGPDFTSRLIGHINIRGPNKVDINDSFWVLRRAVLLRSFIEKYMPTILDEIDTGIQKANIDESLIDTFLDVNYYFHGSRSMETIIRMSASKNKKKFQFSDLPSIEQLDIHVKGKNFNKKLNDKKPIPYDLIKFIANNQFMNIQKYYKNLKEKPEMYDEYLYKSGRGWEETGFDKAEQEPYFRDAEFLFEILEILGYEYEESDQEMSFELLSIDPKIMSHLLVLEHDRWIIDRVSTGWVYFDEHIFGLKGFPSLKPLICYENDISDKKTDNVQYLYVLKFLDYYIRVIPKIFSESKCLIYPKKKKFNKNDVSKIIKKIDAFYKDQNSYIQKRNKTLSIRTKFHIDNLAANLFENQKELMKEYFGLASAENFDYKYNDLPKRKKIFFENWAESITKDFFDIDYSIIPTYPNRGIPNVDIKFIDSDDDKISIAKKIHERWTNYLKANGWCYYEDKSIYLEKKSKMLLPYPQLEDQDSMQQLLIGVAKNYPKILTDSNIILYKLNQPINKDRIMEAEIKRDNRLKENIEEN